MDKEDLTVTVSVETQKDGTKHYKIVREGERTSQTSWWTRSEAEDLFAQLEQKLYKGG